MISEKPEITREVFQKLVSYYAHETFRGEFRPRVGNRLYYPLWFVERQIRVFWEAGITENTVHLIIEAIRQRFREVDGVPEFNFEHYGPHQSALDQIRNAMVGGALNPDRLLEMCLTEEYRNLKRGTQHGDIIITRRPLLNDRVSWGYCYFKYGVMIFALYGQRQENKDFLWRIAKHEASHLVGMWTHCDELNVAGYRYDPRCNMHYAAERDYLCPKCADLLDQWWNQIRYDLTIAGLKIR